MLSWRKILVNVHVALLQSNENDGQMSEARKSALAISAYLQKLQSPEENDIAKLLSPDQLQTMADTNLREDLNTKKTDQPAEEATHPVDFRFLDLSLSGFRKFPVGNTFTLRLSEPPKTAEEKRQPSSLILVGRNSVGKSSLYDSMEYIFTGQVSEAELRSIERQKFILHGDEILLPSITVETCSKKIASFDEFSSSEGYFPVNGCFCSEADIIAIGKISDTETYIDGFDFFASSFGYENLVRIKTVLQQYDSHSWRVGATVQDNGKREQTILEYRKKLEDLKQRIEIYHEEIAAWLDDRSEHDKHLADIVAAFSERIGELKAMATVSSDELSHLIDDAFKELSGFTNNIRGLNVQLSFWDEKKKSFQDRIDSGIPSSRKLLDPGENADANNRNMATLLDFSKYLESLRFSALIKESVSSFRQSVLEYNNQEILLKKEEDALKSYKRFCGVGLYLQTLDNELRVALRGQLTDIRPFVVETMELFTGGLRDKEKISIDDDWKISLQYEEGGENKKISPKKFYNTFRYKLFCMMLRISTAVCLMKARNFLFPIVLDDIFYASDFYNRRLIRRFIKHFIDVSEKTVGKGQIQLICFTHDEVVFSAIYEAIREKREMDRFIFGRLHDYRAVLPDEKGVRLLYNRLCWDHPLPEKQSLSESIKSVIKKLKDGKESENKSGA